MEYDQAWLRWRGEFYDILDERFYTPEWLNGEVWSGRMVLFYRDGAAVLVSIKAYPTSALELHGIGAAGDWATIVGALIPEAEAWGRKMGCIVAVIESRGAWAKVLKDSGYALYQTNIRKELT